MKRWTHLLVLVAAVAGAADFDNPVERLNARLAGGAAKLKHDGGRRGYLMGLLEALDIDPASQMLVFSKTSLQMDRIAPTNPRALFFNDEVSVGFVPGGTLLELATFDAEQGVVFYTMDVRAEVEPKLEVRDRECASCHSSTPRAQMVVQSVYPQEDGTPFISLGTIMPLSVNHTTAFEDRWGGWYVTGTHGKMRHRGNSLPPNPFKPLEVEGPQNVTTLAAAGQGRFDASVYPSQASDLVALMVFEHQMHVTNLLARFNLLHRRGQDRSEADVAPAVDEIVQALFFAGEAKLTDAIGGVSGFAESFPKRGPRDARGRGLRDLDLRTRLFRYPLSYMIYSPVYGALPERARVRLERRMAEVLEGKGGEAYAHLTEGDRAAIREILGATKPEMLPR